MSPYHIIEHITPKYLFLLDGIGALISACLLGIILPIFDQTFNMPKPTLICLAILALCFAIYSLTCHIALQHKWKPYLKFIAYTNISYCILTAGLVVYFYQRLTGFDLLYFILEIFVLILLAWIELCVAHKKA